jgi:hypothetical protein
MGISNDAEYCREAWLAQVHQHAELLQLIVPRGRERNVCRNSNSKNPMLTGAGFHTVVRLVLDVFHGLPMQEEFLPVRGGRPTPCAWNTM